MFNFFNAPSNSPSHPLYHPQQRSSHPQPSHQNNSESAPSLVSRSLVTAGQLAMNLDDRLLAANNEAPAKSIVPTPPTSSPNGLSVADHHKTVGSAQAQGPGPPKLTLAVPSASAGGAGGGGGGGGGSRHRKSITPTNLSSSHHHIPSGNDGAHPIMRSFKFNGGGGLKKQQQKRKKEKDQLDGGDAAERRTLVDIGDTLGNNGAAANNQLSSIAVSPDVKPHDFDIITLNVSGLRFQTVQHTLERFPKTLLGNRTRRLHYFNDAENEYFFDRHRASFESILYFYQSNGRIKRPENVPLDVFLRELRFFEMNEDVMDLFWASEGYVKPEELPMPDNKIFRIIWQLMEHPDTGWAARIVAFISVFVIILSIVSFCLETIPDLKDGWKANLTTLHNCSDDLSERRNVEHCQNVTTGILVNVTEIDHSKPTLDWSNPFFCVEFVCIMWFTVEFVLRLISCPSKVAFLKSFLNIIDIMAIAPFYVNLIWSDSSSGSSMSFAVLRVLRLVRVFRIFKLSRHSVGLQILGKTFAASVQELCLLFFFMLIALVLFSSAVYFAESGVEGSHFQSIPHTFWYVIVTMTTVGYGDLVPKGPAGKLVGTSCAILGVLVLALPVPVIVGNFKHFYRQETKLAHIAAMDEEDDVPEDNVSTAS